eukprot:GEZU01012909.1.p1 GENE.GEZU01012909.1~~GEZU01012909.1.p1  ORF type:complete len:391 (+),score=87.71 GEZU01012909.1:67-1239(+)
MYLSNFNPPCFSFSDEMVDDDANMFEGEAGGDDEMRERNVEEEEDNIPSDAVAEFRNHGEPVYSVALHPEYQNMVVSGGGDDTAYVWYYPQCQPLYQLKGHTDSITEVAFNYDGKLIATASLDATIKIWDSATGELSTTVEGPGEGIEWIQWHQKGNILLAGSSDGTAWMWNIKSKASSCLQVFAGHSASVTCGGFTSDGKNVVTGSADGSLRVWNPRSGTSSAVFSGDMFTSGSVLCVQGSIADPSVILSGAQDGSIALVHAEHNKILGVAKSHHSDSVESVAWSTTLPYFASGSMDGKLCIWDANTMQPRRSCQHDDGITKVIWHPTAPLIFSSSLDKTVRLWDGRSGQQVRVWRGHKDIVLEFQTTKNGEYIVTGSDDGSALVFENK